jgi:4-carboxymuconolactone decarboxylase
MTDDHGRQWQPQEDAVNEDEFRACSAEVAKRRTAVGRANYLEVMLHEAPPPVSPFTENGVVDSVFGELWGRPGLSRRDRRWITLACVAAAAVDVPIETHVYAALASGDISPEEFQEFVLHFAYYAGWPRASSMQMEFYKAVARLDAERSPSGDRTADA